MQGDVGVCEGEEEKEGAFVVIGKGSSFRQRRGRRSTCHCRGLATKNTLQKYFLEMERGVGGSREIS